MLRLETNPSMTADLIDELVDVWVDVVNAGGTVGFAAPTDAATVRPAAEAHARGVGDGSQDLVVARDEDGRVAGFGFLERNDMAITAHWASVARLQRRVDLVGRGVGAMVLTALEDIAAERGVTLMTLSVREHSGRERFYQSQGYRIDGRLPGRLRMADGSALASVYLSKALGPDDPRQPVDGTAPDLEGQVPLKVRRLDPDLALPAYAHPGDAGLDLRAAEAADLPPGERVAVGTGIAIELPEGTVGLVHPRSGLARRHGVGMVNAPGTIDAGYRGEVVVLLINHDPREAVRIERGDRIAQLLVQRIEAVGVVEVDELGQSTRGDGGFGSTGR